jgi:hypothetical protein
MGMAHGLPLPRWVPQGWDPPISLIFGVQLCTEVKHSLFFADFLEDFPLTCFPKIKQQET